MIEESKLNDFEMKGLISWMSKNSGTKIKPKLFI